MEHYINTVASRVVKYSEYSWLLSRTILSSKFWYAWWWAFL